MSLTGFLFLCVEPAGQEHWDTCQEAGPARRPAEPFGKPIPNLQVLSFDGAKLQFLRCNTLQFKHTFKQSCWLKVACYKQSKTFMVVQLTSCNAS